LLNFHYDPVTCAVALGWSGVTIEEMSPKPELEHGIVQFRRTDAGRPTRVVTDVDGHEFSETWLEAVETLGATARAGN
jgi:hypothetical protein